MENIITFNNLTLEEIKELKKEAAEDIMKAIQRFENKSGMNIHRIHINSVDPIIPDKSSLKTSIEFEFYL